MNKTLRTFALSALAALTVGFTAVEASAAPHDGPRVENRIKRDRDGGPDRPRHGHHGQHGHNGGSFGIYIGSGFGAGPAWDAPRHYGRGRCNPELAVAKARDYGLRRARVTEMNRRVVEVSGKRHGNWRTMYFANQRACPVIR